jgi:hypothetical protein
MYNAEEGTQINEVATGQGSALGSWTWRHHITIVEGDAFSVQPLPPIKVSAAGALTGVVIARFKNTGWPGHGVADFTATVDWGDGSQAENLTPVIGSEAGTIEIHGTHVYKQAMRPLRVVTTLSDPPPGTATAQAQTMVLAAAPGKIGVSPTAVDLGPVGLNLTRARTLSISNIGSSDTILTGSVQSPSPPFSVTSGGGAFSLAGGQTQTVSIAFQSPNVGSFDDNVVITSNDPNAPSVSVSLHGEIAVGIDLWLNAFIPNSDPPVTFTLAPPNSFAGTSVVRGPYYEKTGELFFTDQRTFSSDSTASSRMHSEYNVNIPFGPVFVNEIEQPGPTIEITPPDGESEPYGVSCNESADNSRMHFDNLRGSAALMQVDLVAAANNPCVRGSPDIDYIGTVTIDVEARTVSFSGMIEPFPAFEMYSIVNNYPAQPLFQVTPKPGDDPWNLFGPASVPVNGSAPFSP